MPTDHNHGLSHGVLTQAPFSRLFEAVDEPPVDDAVLRALSATMLERAEPVSPAGERKRLGSSRLFAGYTYFAQFVDHDLTLDLTRFNAEPGRQPSNGRTPRFDLDSVFGGGPQNHPVLYGDDGRRLRLGAEGRDLMRHPDGSACIADARNDANAIVGQLHLAFARGYNRALAESPELGFEEARQKLRWHYQWIVFHELLPTLLPDALRARYLPAGEWDAAGRARWADRLRLFKRVNGDPPAVPVEFSGAAYRFGHSMVRHRYLPGGPGTVQLPVFKRAEPNNPAAKDFRGHRPLTAERIIDWRHFFLRPDEPVTPDLPVQLARPIDTLIAPPLYSLPFDVSDGTDPDACTLPYRNLRRGEAQLKLPSGQAVAEFLVDAGLLQSRSLLTEAQLLDFSGLPIDPDNIAGTGVSLATMQRTLSRRAPLWYYLLKEAQYVSGGERLGPVAGTVVAEVLLGLLVHDDESLVHAGRNWQPMAGQFGCRVDGRYDLLDLLDYAA